MTSQNFSCSKPIKTSYGDNKCKSVHKLQTKILNQKFKKQNTVELIMLPLCSCNLEFQTKRLNVFEREEHLLQNGLLHFVFRFSQLSEITLES